MVKERFKRVTDADFRILVGLDWPSVGHERTNYYSDALFSDCKTLNQAIAAVLKGTLNPPIENPIERSVRDKHNKVHWLET